MLLRCISWVSVSSWLLLRSCCIGSDVLRIVFDSEVLLVSMVFLCCLWVNYWWILVCVWGDLTNVS